MTAATAAITVGTVAAATDRSRLALVRAPAPAGAAPPRDQGDQGASSATAKASPARARSLAGADRATVVLFTLAAFLAVLALLASQLRAAPSRRAHVIVLRKVYETRVINTVVGSAGGGSSVSESVSGSSSTSGATSGPATRSS